MKQHGEGRACHSILRPSSSTAKAIEGGIVREFWTESSNQTELDYKTRRVNRCGLKKGRKKGGGKKKQGREETISKFRKTKTERSDLQILTCLKLKWWCISCPRDFDSRIPFITLQYNIWLFHIVVHVAKGRTYDYGAIYAVDESDLL